MSDRRPNVLLILQDQLRFDVVHDPELCRTPVQDRLREQGTAFLNHYAPLGVCSPSRASLLTGLYPHANGVMNNMNGTDAFVADLPAENPNLAELLGGAGYRTGYVGKWHLGKQGPRAHGFDDQRALEDELLDPTGRFGPCWQPFHDRSPEAVMTRYPTPTARHAAQFARKPFPMYSTAPIAESAHPAVAVVEASQELLRDYAAGEAPFLLFTSFLEPHWPNVLPEPYASMYDPADVEPWPNLTDDFTDKPRTLQAALEHFGVADFTWDDWAPLIARYLGAVSFVDDLVGRLLDTLDDLGIADDTLVVSSCDHGDMAGAHRQFNKGPLMYEEVYHIPFVVRWPGEVDAGGTQDRLTSHIDLVPTVLEATGVAAPDGLHGASVLPLLRGEREAWRDSLMAEYHGDEFGLYTQRMVRHDRYKLIYNPHDIVELYDLEADPHELTNLAGDPEHRQLRRDLEVRLLELMHEFDDPHRLWAVNTLG